MQDAYQLYFEGKNDEAMEKVKEVIIASPDSSAPFHLMCRFYLLPLIALIYESSGDDERVLNWLGLAAKLESNSEIWLRWVSLALKTGKVPTALYWYNRAIKCDK